MRILAAWESRTTPAAHTNTPPYCERKQQKGGLGRAQSSRFLSSSSSRSSACEKYMVLGDGASFFLSFFLSFIGFGPWLVRSWKKDLERARASPRKMQKPFSLVGGNVRVKVVSTDKGVNVRQSPIRQMQILYAYVFVSTETESKTLDIL